MESNGINCEEVSCSGEALAVSDLTIKFISLYVKFWPVSHWIFVTYYFVNVL